jgi:drug/metabolite transporter (DMT)-like permease
MLIYLPPYAMVAGAGIFDAPPSAVALQALVQGLLTAVFSYVLYGVAVSILGASSGAAFAASCPAMTALMAIPILGEWPSSIEWAAIALISVGVYVVSGGPMPRWRN